MTVSDRLKDIVKEPRKEARNRYKKPGKKAPPPPPPAPTPGGTAGTGGGQSPTPTDPPAPGTPPGPPPFGGPKPKPPKPAGNPIRIVDSGNAPWERKKGFTGETVEVSPRIPALVELVRAIDSDVEAKQALSQFLLALEQAGVLKNFEDA